MPRDNDGTLTTITRDDVVDALIESISADASLAEHAGGTGVFAEGEDVITDRWEQRNGSYVMTLAASDGSRWLLSVTEVSG